MIWLKACPRCLKGDLFLSEDYHGQYRQCFQCSYMEDVTSDDLQLLIQAQQKKEPVTSAVA